jgi:hypothetical protein
METQTDGIEWVMATLFVGLIVVAVVAMVREFKQGRKGDPGGEEARRRR